VAICGPKENPIKIWPQRTINKEHTGSGRSPQTHNSQAPHSNWRMRAATHCTAPERTPLGKGTSVNNIHLSIALKLNPATTLEPAFSNAILHKHLSSNRNLSEGEKIYKIFDDNTFRFEKMEKNKIKFILWLKKSSLKKKLENGKIKTWKQKLLKKIENS
jgi:hypothetical protein